jgi:MarR family transcriptional regulator for hemolysin
MSIALKDEDDANEARLIHEIARQVRVSFDRRVKPLGLTRSQWYAFGILRRHPQGISQTKLAYLMEIKPISLVRLLDRMEKTGWVERRADPKDRRANAVVLTKKANAIVAKMMVVARGVRNETLKGFTAGEHRQLLTYLKRMKINTMAMTCLEEESTCIET